MRPCGGRRRALGSRTNEHDHDIHVRPSALLARVALGMDVGAQFPRSMGPAVNVRDRTPRLCEGDPRVALFVAPTPTIDDQVMLSVTNRMIRIEAPPE